MSILSAVAQQLSFEHIYSLTLVSKRLHRLITPLLAQKVGLDTGASIPVITGEAFSALEIWGRWLDFIPPEEIHFVLSANTPQAIIQCVHVEAFFRPLQLSRAIDKVHIVLSASTCNIHTSAISAILDSGVRAFSAYQTDYSSHPSPTSGHFRLPNALSALGVYPHLQVFEPKAPLLFGPVYLPLTLQIINLSSITELLFPLGQLNLPVLPELDKLLRHIDVPGLRRLTMEGHIHIPALVDFLNRHPALENLHIGPRSVSRCATSQPYVPERSGALRRLQIIRAPLTYLSLLVGTSSWATPSRLCQLDALPDVSLPASEFVLYVSTILQGVVRLKWLFALSISFPQSIGQAQDVTFDLPGPCGDNDYASLQTLTISMYGEECSPIHKFSTGFLVCMQSSWERQSDGFPLARFERNGKSASYAPTALH